MVSLPRPRGQTGTLALLLALTATVSAGSAAKLFARDSGTCPANSDFCQGNFPSNFCCPSGNACISLAANTTVLCCPPGSKCVTIYPLSCDITQQDPSTNPDAPVKTIALTGKMEQCGDGTCCPFGYSCNGSGKCQRAADQSTPPPGYTPPGASASSSTTATTAAAPTTSASNSTLPNSSASPSTSSPPAASESENSPGGPSVGVIAGAVIGTIGGGVMLALVALYCIKRKASLSREKKEADKRSSSFGNIISAPLASPPGSVMRNDFMRKPVSGGGGSFEFNNNDSLPRHVSPQGSVQAESRYGPEKARYTIPNPFNDAESRWSGEPGLGDESLVSPSSTTFSGHRLPSTPPPNRGRAREPSAFSINVFATEDTLSNPGTPPPPLPTDNRFTHMTTFTSMMEAAGMSGVGDRMPYVPEDAYGPRTDAEGSPERRR